jgi:hypothetical protein
MAPLVIMSEESAEKHDSVSLSLKLAFPNSLDDYIGKVVREGAYLEDVMMECVAILGGLGNDVDILLMGQPWDWLHSMAVGFQKEPVYATRRCNHEALPEIAEALAEANAIWKKRNDVVHASWMLCPALRGYECAIAARNGGEVNEDEYHVVRSRRRQTERLVEHRSVDELEELVVEFEAVRVRLVEALKAFDSKHFR